VFTESSLSFVRYMMNFASRSEGLMVVGLKEAKANLCLTIDRTHPSLFQPAEPSQPPIQLSEDAIKATVLASAASFPAIASSLTAVSDSPIPDPAQSAALVALLPRMNGIQATQYAQAAEIAELQSRSEQVIRDWYEHGFLNSSQFVANVEGRVEQVERSIRRAEREKEAEATM
jgi:hypothetical protein